MSRAEPRISVVMPLYNKGRYVEEAVRSVLRSTFPPLELIVVDDGSTDEGPQRVTAIADSRLRLLRQENAGVSSARNRGIRAARGDYVAFLDADDCWEPAYLAAIATLIRELPGCGLYATHYYRFTADGQRRVDRLWGVDRSRAAQRVTRFFEVWSHMSFFCTCSAVVPAEVLRASRIAFPEGEGLGEDLDVWFRIAERWDIAYCPEPLVGYRLDLPGSLSKSPAPREMGCMRRLALRCRAPDFPERHRSGARRLLAVDRILSASRLVAQGERSGAIERLAHPQCLRVPRFWLRTMLAACMPGVLGERFLVLSD
jgi:glycosyltransferase involved in cell wall biosynthesis